MADGATPRQRRRRLPMPEPYGLRREDAAAYIGISPGTFDKGIESGEIPQGVLICGVRVWPRPWLERVLDPNRATPRNSWDDD